MRHVVISWCYAVGRHQLTAQQLSDLLDRAIESHARYTDYWREFDTADRDHRHNHGLTELLNVLEQSARELRELAPEAMTYDPGPPPP